MPAGLARTLRSGALRALWSCAGALRGRRQCRALAAVVVLVAVGSASVAPVAQARAAVELPPQGIFENCPLSSRMTTCLQRLHTMRSGGLRIVVIPATAGAPADLGLYAAAARTLGMGVMWELSDPGWWQNTSTAGAYGDFSRLCVCSEPGALLRFMIHFLAALPGTYGYYAADDSMLTPADRAGVSRYISTIKATDPAHAVVLSSADASQTAQYAGIGDMNAAEIYPVSTGSLMPSSENLAAWDGVAQTAAEDQRIATRAGQSSAFILQAFTFGDNVDDGQAVGACGPSDSPQQCYGKLLYPTGAAQLKLRDEVLTHAHPKLILWWSFPGTAGQADADTYSIYPTGETAALRWAGLSAAITAPAPASPGALPRARAAAASSWHHRHHRHHRRRRRRASI